MSIPAEKLDTKTKETFDAKYIRIHIQGISWATGSDTEFFYIEESKILLEFDSSMGRNNINVITDFSIENFSYYLSQFKKAITDCEPCQIKKSFIDECVGYYSLLQVAEKAKKDILKEKPIIETAIGKATKHFQNGNNLLDNKNADEKSIKDAIIEYETSMKLIPTSENISSCMYNIACCHARLKNKNLTFEYLNKASDRGYNNWRHTIEDDDLKEYKHDFEFIELIKKMHYVNPNSDKILVYIGNTVPYVHLWFLKHGIPHFAELTVAQAEWLKNNPY